MKLIRIFTLLTILGCSNENPYSVQEFPFTEFHQTSNEFYLEFSSTEKIALDSITLPFYDYHQTLVSEGEPFLLGFNRQNSSIDIISLENKSENHHIFFDEDGPGAIFPDLDIFFLDSNQNLFTIQDREKKYKHFGKDGQFSMSYSLNLTYENTTLYPVAYSTQGQYPIFKDSIWILAVYPEENPKGKAYYNYPKFVTYSPKTNKVLNYFGFYPNEYRKEFYFDINREPGILPRGNNYLVFYPALSTIFEYDENGKPLKEHVYESLKANEMQGTKRNADFQQIMDNYISEPWFGIMLFDPHKEVYYRFSKHKQPLLNHENIKNTIYDSEWTLYIIDNELNIIGKSELDTKIFNPLFCFTTAKGLWIFKNNQQDENKAEFGIFTIQDNYNLNTK